MYIFIIAVLAIVLVVVATNLSKAEKKLKECQSQSLNKSTEISELQRHNSELQRYASELNEKIGRLIKYEKIIDAEEESKAIILKANYLLKKTEQDMRIAADLIDEEIVKSKDVAKQIVAEAKSEAQVIRQKAVVVREKAEEEALAKINNATTQSDLIIEGARNKAVEIGGDAYLSLEKTKFYQDLLKSLENIVDGYGNKYIIPMHSFLDDLADDFGYTEAGAELKKAREITRNLIESNNAGMCDYVEKERREAAINFAVDAFNGKVDTILSSLKADNFGTVEQKIKDAFALINHLGQPFKNGRIKVAYLNARIQEAYWACIAIELKMKQQEEQRQIKEQIREEEKARREFERAMKEAAKEEEMLKKAMDKVQKELSAASEEQRAKYEEKLAELNKRLVEAEEKNQRAISMAQQTRSGHVYVISNIGSFGEDVYKIGMTRRLEPKDRIKELGDASVPFEFDVHALIYSDDAPGLEKELHKTFVSRQMNKINPRKEFFKLGLKDIKDHLDTKDIKAQWTMVAEAREYRETQALEKELAENEVVQQQWMLSQANEIDKIELSELEEVEVNQ
ncbi:Meiotically Up-regulated Gene 113 (MUG113) protein [Breznakibacter xylanolyticus]|uniref:Meiotically Up-regulated Gene 113 (MUG113) protein n=1 Tax=Breznakibacter xylanolyticus TaxID=990 RepID=A0A2W7P3S5_9BACT|nr:DUF4041 domain-containing protein [Breznakibacter xylanolyticus]PZX18062.1 Meiotically Up-regulated Gene 113 (MUG113) protein [Breznakibacter xylanolyticus]